MDTMGKWAIVHQFNIVHAQEHKQILVKEVSLFITLITSFLNAFNATVMFILNKVCSMYTYNILMMLCASAIYSNQSSK